MYSKAKEPAQNKGKAIANALAAGKSKGEAASQLKDNRAETISPGKLKEMADNSPQAQKMKGVQEIADQSPQVEKATQLQSMFSTHPVQLGSMRLPPSKSPEEEMKKKLGKG